MFSARSLAESFFCSPEKGRLATMFAYTALSDIFDKHSASRRPWSKPWVRSPCELLGTLTYIIFPLTPKLACAFNILRAEYMKSFLSYFFLSMLTSFFTISYSYVNAAAHLISLPSLPVTVKTGIERSATSRAASHAGQTFSASALSRQIAHFPERSLSRINFPIENDGKFRSDILPDKRYDFSEHCNLIRVNRLHCLVFRLKPVPAVLFEKAFQGGDRGIFRFLLLALERNGKSNAVYLTEQNDLLFADEPVYQICRIRQNQKNRAARAASKGNDAEKLVLEGLTALANLPPISLAEERNRKGREGFLLIQKAAEQGNPAAQYFVGRAYYYRDFDF